MLRRTFLVAWTAWVLVGLLLEAAALLRRDTGDTLSELIWSILDRHPIFWWTGLGLWAWATHHFFFRDLRLSRVTRARAIRDTAVSTASSIALRSAS